MGVIAAPPTSSHVVIGAPGSGKTSLLVERAAHLVDSGLHPDRVRVLTPTRQSATRLRDVLSERIPRATRGALAHSVASLAFSIVAADHVTRHLPPPTLRSGADIDEDIRDLLGDPTRHQSPFADLFEPQVIATETFRTELRELMARVIEHGHGPDDLVAWGRAYEIPEWEVAGSFMASYLEAIARARPTSFDAAELITRAGAIIDRGLPDEWEHLAVVLVDDTQDIPASARRLIVALHRQGVSVTAVGDPDVAGQTFRGSHPDAPALLADALDVGPVYSTTVFRHGPTLQSTVSELSQRVGSSRAGQQRQADTPSADGVLPVGHLLSPSATDEDTAIARYIAQMIHREGLAPDRVAVISRRAGALDGVSRALSHQGIPSHLTHRMPLGSQPAARELLWWVEAARHPERVTEERAGDMLRGLYGGWSALDLRRFTTWVRGYDASAGVSRRTSEAVRDVVVGGDAFVGAPAGVSARIDRTRKILTLIRDCDSDTPVDVVLGVAWQAVGVEEIWRRKAVAGGDGARAANSNLDAVVGLMETAARFAGAHESVSAAVFVTRVLSQDVAEDVIVPPPLTPAVWLGTASAAVGNEWELVVLHGVNDGVWPNLRLRGSFLGAPLIADVSRGLTPGDVDQRRVVLDDEMRMAVLAASRATTRLVVSAVSADDVSPSPLFTLLADGTPRLNDEALPVASVAELVGRRRLTLAAGGDTGAKTQAAQELAYLASVHAPGADPDTWWGVMDPTTTKPLFADDVVRLSPSKVSDIEASPLLWLLDVIAPEPLPPVVDAGAIIHRALEENPWGPLEAMEQVVNSRWSEIPFDSAWLADAKRVDALRQVRALASYLDDQRDLQVTLVASEERFAIEIPGARLSGVMDRLVRLADGRYVVVDLKTGRHKTDSQVVDDPQLLAYQLAITTPDVVGSLGGAVETAGAYLLYVSSGVRGKPYRIALQPPLDEAGREAFLARLGEVSRTVASERFAVGEADSTPTGRPPKHRWHLIGQVCGD
jgi:superfamily I DNA/RNA helicase/RecB family exonuclease